MLDLIYKNLIVDEAYATVLNGLLVTVQISVLSVIFGTLLGAVVCMARISKIKVVSKIFAIYIEIIRGSPVLMLLLLMYYVAFAGSNIDAVWVAVITYSINFSAYAAEIMRSALSATDKEQVEAARTLGFSRFTAFKLITLPQAIKIAEPVYHSAIINLIQWTSVVGYISIMDLTKVINVFSARTMQPVFMIVTGMTIYILLSYIVRAIFALLRLRRKEEYNEGRQK